MYIQISDLQGRIVYKKIETAASLIPVNSNLKPGGYILQVKNNSLLLSRQKLLVQ
jgi:hypothetical protein